METIIEIRKNQIFKKWTSSGYWKLGGIQFLKSDLIPTDGNTFYAFFLLVETIIKIRRNSIFEKYNC